jgi:hypothetical protein
MGKCFKNIQTKNNNFKKQIKKNMQNKTVITIIFDGIFDRVNGSIDTRVWKGRRFENILKWTVIPNIRKPRNEKDANIVYGYF